jgi:hypothetical protein
MNDEEFRRTVALMRALGVVEYASIVLDPMWVPAPEKKRLRSAAEQAKIADRWLVYRAAFDLAQQDGTELPDPPTEPERE